MALAASFAFPKAWLPKVRVKERDSSPRWRCWVPSPPASCATLTSPPSSLFPTVWGGGTLPEHEEEKQKAGHWPHPLRRDSPSWGERRAYRKRGGTNLAEALSPQGTARPLIDFPSPSLSQQRNTHISVPFSTHHQNARKLPVPQAKTAVLRVHFRGVSYPPEKTREGGRKTRPSLFTDSQTEAQRKVSGIHNLDR